MTQDHRQFNSLMNAPRVTAGSAFRTTALLAVLLFAATEIAAQTKRIYTVRAGDTLYRIAVNHNLTVEQLQALNGLEGTVIEVGQVLRLTDAPVDLAVPSDSSATVADTLRVVEVPSGPPEAPRESEPQLPEEPRAVQAVVDSVGTILYGEYAALENESLFDIAHTLGVPIDTLRNMNPDHSIVLADGDPVRVPGGLASMAYTVKAGDTLFGIAAAHGVTIGELRVANPGAGNIIRVGQVLQIPSGSRPAEPVLPLVIAEGPASIYPDRFEGRLMASGRTYDPAKHTLSHPTLPFGTIVTIENAESGRATFAEVADRMPVSTEFVVEISRATAEAIGLGEEAIRVRILFAADDE